MRYRGGPKAVPDSLTVWTDTALMATYAEYCPIAAGAECLADRWTLLILREMMVGAHRFNDIHRGIPRISRTLLSQRLRTLVNGGLWNAPRWAPPGVPPDRGRPGPRGRDLGGRQLACAGRSSIPRNTSWILCGVVWQTAPSGQLRPEAGRADHGGGSCTGARHPGRAWLVSDRNAATGCEMDPGYEVDLVVLRGQPCAAPLVLRCESVASGGK